MMQFLALYVAWIGVASLLTFFAFGVDKWQARKDGRRIAERTLHTLALLGGWPGSLIGQRVFRHKTQKVSFRLVSWTVVVLHVAVVTGIAVGIVWALRDAT